VKAEEEHAESTDEELLTTGAAHLLKGKTISSRTRQSPAAGAKDNDSSRGPTLSGAVTIM